MLMKYNDNKINNNNINNSGVKKMHITSRWDG